MAKNKVEIDVVVDDKGSTKKVGLGAKKAGEGLDNVAKGARTADRNLKGAANASSNTTKNFSKMAQGTGGLVGAYATLAANIFAVSAAFQFLKSAADFRVVQDAQVAFTGATGQGMRTLTNEIQTASDAMLNFQAASEAASIGIASGLGAGQITELAEGAANVAKILGRDVTDSFNRLVRGVTKAEPELLDELGITLRLADAQENYAATLNKSAKDLSNFEKKQAVFAEVQGQLAEKYNHVAAATDIQANAMDKLAVAFDEVLKPVKSFFALIGEPVAEFFSKNIRSFAIALGLLAVPLIKQLIPGLTNFAEKAEESAQRASAAFEQTKLDIQELEAVKAAAAADPIGAGKGALKGIDVKEGTGAGVMQAGGTPSKRQLAAMKRSANKGVGIVKKMTKQQKRAYIAAIDAMIAGNSKLDRSWKRTTDRVVATTKIATKRIQVIWQKTMSFMSKAAAKMGKAVNRAMKLLGVIGIIMMVADLGKSILEFFGFFKEDEALTEFKDKIQETTSAMKESIKEFEKFADMQNEMRKRFDGEGNLTHVVDRTRESIAAFGKQTAQVAPQIISLLETLATNPLSNFSVKSTNINEFGKRVRELQKLNPEMSRFEAGEEANKEGYFGSQGSATKYKNKLKGGGLLSGLFGGDNFEEQAQLAGDTLQEVVQIAIEGTKATGMAATDSGREYLMYLNILKSTGKLAPEQAKRFTELAKEIEETGGMSAFLKQQQKEVNKQFTAAKNAIQMFITPQTKLISLINDQIKAEEKLLKQVGDNEGAKKRLAELRTQLKFMTKLEGVTINLANETKKLNAIRAQSMIGATPLQKEQINNLTQIAQIEAKRRAILDKMNLNSEGDLTLSEAQREAMQHELHLLNAQQEQVERNIDRYYQLVDAMTAAAEGSTQVAIADLIKGNESSFKDAIMGIAQSTLEAAADQLAKQLTSDIFSFAKKETPEEKMKKAMVEGGAIAAKQIKDALAGTLTGDTGNTSEDLIGGGSDIGGGSGTGKGSGTDGKTGSGLGIGEKLKKLGSDFLGIESGGQTDGVTAEDIAEGKNLPKGTMEEVIVTGGKGKGLKGIFDGFVGNVESIFHGDQGFLEGLGNIFKDGLDGFGDLFGDLFSGLFGGEDGSGLFTDILKGVGSFFLPGARNGGVFSQGKKVQGYASGGIARGSTAGYPAVLHGTEAVVPLPHGGKIPVEMKGGGSQQNNVVVNVSTDGTTSTESADDDQAEGLGQAIAIAVQREMQNQKRSGGILSPYGAS